MTFAFRYTCQTCGCEFGSNSVNARYCTRRCRDKKQRERRKELDNLRTFDNLSQGMPQSGQGAFPGHRAGSAMTGSIPSENPNALPEGLASDNILSELGFTSQGIPNAPADDDRNKNEPPAGKEPSDV